MKTNRKILVVDDEAVVGHSIQRVLSQKGYAVINCTNGAEALEKLHKEEYDAVFTDIKMPNMSGMELSAKIKADQPWMPVVIITGYASEQYQSEADKLGVSSFLCKPLAPDDIELSAAKAVHEKEMFVEAVDKVVNAPIQVKAIEHTKNVGLFFAAPFIGLAYVVAMPVVGFGALAYVGFKAAMKNKVFQILAAPFIGLAFVLTLPFAGLATMSYMGFKAAFK